MGAKPSETRDLVATAREGVQIPALQASIKAATLGPHPDFVEIRAIRVKHFGMVFMRWFLEALGYLFWGAIISVGQLASAPIEVASLARRKNQSAADVRICGRRTS